MRRLLSRAAEELANMCWLRGLYLADVYVRIKARINRYV